MKNFIKKKNLGRKEKLFIKMLQIRRKASGKKQGLKEKTDFKQEVSK